MTTDPVTLAREVLETAHEDDTITVCSVPDNKAAALAHTVRRTVPALDAVLELHKPVQARMTSSDGVRDVTVCDHCLDPTWPCQTVAAITTARAAIPADTLVDPLDDHHPAVQAAARAALAEGWTCDTHEPRPWGECRDCTESHLRTARRALTAALPYLTAPNGETRA